MAQRWSTDVALQVGIAHKLGRRLLTQTQGVMVRCGARETAAAGINLPGYAAIDEQELATRTELEGEAPGAGRTREHYGWGRPDVDQNDARSPLQPHVPGALNRGR